LIREAAFQNRSVVQFKAMPNDMSKYLVKAGLLARLFTLAGLFHEPHSPAPFHAIKGADNDFSIENGQ
jgi:hypothetical protein